MGRGSILAVIVAVLVAVATAGSGLARGAEPVTGAADNLRTGWDPNEPSLSPATVQSGRFGRLFDTPVQGQVYAQPLLHDETLLAVTEENRVYGIDPGSGSIRWEDDAGKPWRSADINCENPGPYVGITSTPVIDPETDTAYFTTKTYEDEATNEGPAVWKMHAVDVATGQERPGFPVEIAGRAENISNTEFDPTQELQRPALLLMEGVVYAAFSGLCDKEPFQGWIAGVSAYHGGLEVPRLTALWAAASGGASIWQGGSGLVSDGPGRIFFATGNANTPGWGIGGSSPEAGTPGSEPPENLGETVARIEVQPGGELKATSFFSPQNNEELDDEDLDLASGGPLALPSQYFGTAAFPKLLVQDGKQGVLYVLDREELGGMDPHKNGTDEVVAEVPEVGGLWGAMAVWPGDGGYLYIPSTGEDVIEKGSGVLRALKYDIEGDRPGFHSVGESAETLYYGSGSPLVTSNGTESGSAIVWQTRCPTEPSLEEELHCEGSTLNAYAAVPVEGSMKLLWSGSIGFGTRFAAPTAGGGRIFVGTYDGHVLGFAASPEPGPPAPARQGQPPSSGVDTGQETVGRPNTKLTAVRIRAATGEARFAFKAIGQASYAQCRLMKQTAKGRRRAVVRRFSRCRSPRRYRSLASGRYIFEVRAVGLAGPDQTPARRAFRITG